MSKLFVKKPLTQSGNSGVQLATARRFYWSALALVLLNCILVVPVHAATFTVSKTADTNDGVCDADCSLREAVFVANGNGVADTIAFNIPLADPGYNAGTGVFTITVSSTLQITEAGTTIDGTTQTTNAGNTNPLTLGTGGTVGVGPDGVISTGDEPALLQVAGPEIEIRAGAAIPIGIQVQANNATIRGLAILGFGSVDGDGAIRIENNFTNVLIEQNVIGAAAHSFSDPGAGSRAYTGVHSEGGDSGVLQNNLIGFTFRQGVWLLNGSTGWNVQGNEVRDAGLGLVDGDGMSVTGSASNTISANLVTGSSSQGLVVNTAGSNNNTFINNTVTGNGVGIPSGVIQSTGITLRGSAGPTVLERNVVHANYGAGVQVNDGAVSIRMTLNSFADNGTIVARDLSPPTGQIGIDLNAPGDDGNLGTPPFYSINDPGDGDGGGNNRLNFPIIDTAAITGANLVLSGWARPGSVIEFYIADGQVPGFGEGETYLVTLTEGSGADTDGGSGPYGSPINGLAQGTDTTNRYQFTIPTPAGVGSGTMLTATATVGSDTSEFSGVAPVTVQITGTVFEDADFTGIATDYDGGASDLALPDVDVELYTGGDVYITSTVTDASGNYAFTVGNGDYKVRVRSATIGDSDTPPKGTFNAACGITNPASGPPCVLAGQTWANGAAAYGGQSTTADDTTTNNNAGPGDTWVPVTISGPSVNNVNFGFAYNLVVNTANTGQGSLRQFILNANGIGAAGATTANNSEFRIPATDPGFSGGVATISVTTALPAIDDSGTTIDGTTQSANIGDTNAVLLGAGGTVGVGPDGVAGTGDEMALAQLPAPEIEIVDSAALTIGLDMQASSTTLRGVAIYGFGDVPTSPSASNIRIDNANNYTGMLIEQNVIGSSATSFADPGAGARSGGQNIFSLGSDNGILRNNLIGFAEGGGFNSRWGSSGWTIEGNEFRNNSAFGHLVGDGLSIEGAGSGNATVSGNLIVGNGAVGIETFGADGSINIIENTIDSNGFGTGAGANETPAIRLYGAGSTVVHNLIEGNYGAGVFVSTGSTGNTISENSIAGNGAVSGQVGIDLLAPGDDSDLGTAPFYSVNDLGDVDSGGNNRLNFPIIDTAEIVGGNLTLTGWAWPASVIEFYIADGDGSGFGEGQTYLVTLTEGSGADTDTDSGIYGPGAINGIVQGTDNTNRFSFTIPAPAGVVDGTELTASGTLGGNTSEFSGIATVVLAHTISGRVFEDANFSGTAAGYDGGVNDLALANVDVELYTSGDVYVTSTATDGSGNYSLTAADGNYKVRVRSATIGDSNTLPAGGFNAACGITDPVSGVACSVAEQTWANGAAAYGGQSPTVDDTATDNNAGPGDTWVAITVSGADLTGIDFGFAYNLIANTADTGQGSLRRFMENANAIGAAGGTTANDSEFRIPLTDPNYNGATGIFTITLASALPIVSDVNTAIDGRTQTDNVGNTNAGVFVHPFYGASKAIGTGADGIEGSGDEPSLPVYDNPEIEIDGNDQGIIFELTANDGRLKHLALFNNPSFATGVKVSAGTANVVEENYIGLRADGGDPGAGLHIQHGVEVYGGTASVMNNVVAYTDNTAIIVERESLIWGNDVFSASVVNPNGDGISAEGSSGQSITVLQNRVDFSAGNGFESWQAPGPFTVEDNTISRSGQGGGPENGGIRVFGTGSTVLHNVVNSSAGAGISVVQRGIPGSNQQNRISENAVYSNGGPGIDLDVTNTGGAGNPNGDGVTANNGSLNATLPNSEMDYPVIVGAALVGSTLTVNGYVGTLGTPVAGTHTIEVFKADDDANNNGEIEAGDGLNVPHGEGRWYIDTCTTAVTGVFNCNLTVPAAVSVSIGDPVTATARDVNDNTSEFTANSSVTAGLYIYKRAFWLDGTPIATGATIPTGIEFKFMLYINNRGPAATDISLRDLLDPLFAFQPGTIQVDNSVASCAAQNCTPAEESAIYSSVITMPFLTDAVDGDIASYTPATVDVGDQNVLNAQLDIAAARVLAVAFSAKVQ